MHQEWNDFRLHLNAAFSTASAAEGQELLIMLQHAKGQWDERQAAREGLPMPQADTLVGEDDQPEKGVNWDDAKNMWRVQIAHKGVQRGFGRFGSLPEANAQARGVRAVIMATGRLPRVGWRVIQVE